VSDAAFAEEAAVLVRREYPFARQVRVVVTVVHGFNTGIASGGRSKSYGFDAPP
jgi:hypothetical protein